LLPKSNWMTVPPNAADNKPNPHIAPMRARLAIK